MIRHPLFKLGKKPAQHDSRTIPLRSVLHGVVPVPETYSFHKLRPGCRIGMYGNDQFGCCVKTAQANQTQAFEYVEQGHALKITTEEVVNEYFDETGGEDTGLVMLDSLKRWRKQGWVAAGKRYFIKGFTSLATDSPVEFKQIVYADCGAPIGLRLPDAAMDQFEAGEPWSLFAGAAGQPNPENGHCVLGEGWDEVGPWFVTWNRVQRATWEFYHACCDEANGVFDAKDTAKVQRIVNSGALRKRILSVAA